MLKKNADWILKFKNFVKKINYLINSNRNTYKPVGIRPCVILLQDNKVLCVLSKYNNEEYYLFPGGGIEAGETLVECAIRETEEETGLKTDIVKLVYINEWIKDRATNERVINMFFLGKIKGGEIIQGEKDGGKVKKIEWIELDKFSKLDFRPKFIAKRLKEDYAKGFPETVYFE